MPNRCLNADGQLCTFPSLHLFFFYHTNQTAHAAHGWRNNYLETCLTCRRTYEDLGDCWRFIFRPSQRRILTYLEQTNWQCRKATSDLHGWSEPVRSKARVLSLPGVHPSSGEGGRGGWFVTGRAVHFSFAVYYTYVMPVSGWDLAKLWMKSSQVCVWDLAKLWMRSSQVVRASDSQCRSRNCPGFDPSILRHSGIWGAADEIVLNIVHKKRKNPKYPPFVMPVNKRSFSICFQNLSQIQNGCYGGWD